MPTKERAEAAARRIKELNALRNLQPHELKELHRRNARLALERGKPKTS